MTTNAPDEKAALFRSLHARPGIFLMPNAWDIGSAKVLAAAGFEALGTTSAGVAYSMGRPDDLDREPMMAAVRRIADAVPLPVHADAQCGYGRRLDDVIETVRAVIAAGAVGCSLEDWAGDPSQGLLDAQRAADRIRAARETADATEQPFLLTARAECFLSGHPDPLREAVRRCNLYREAGADCSFVPGPCDRDVIATLVREIDGPLNVVVGLGGEQLALRELEDLGVKRVSIGGSLARAAFGLIRRAAEEMRRGTFGFVAEAVPDAAVRGFFG